jgi:D-alanyl-D-alanine carboxypeptidase (penicillin-binding protein 5/6)
MSRVSAQPFAHPASPAQVAFTPERGEDASLGVPPGGTPAAPPATSAPPKVRAAAAILVDAHTGQVLFNHNAGVRRAPASTTKILTAILILERGGLDEVVTVSKKAALTPYGSLHLRPGEKLTLEDLLYGIMLRSANDGCVAAAEHIAGSEAAFVQRMNNKAREIGAVETHFVTSNGLFAPNHYSTAADLARIACYATRNPDFNALIATSERKIQRSIAKQDSVIRNRNKFLKRYPGADGIKTGYVRQSGFCLVASATHPEAGNPWRLISVVLNSPDTVGESTALLDYGFAQFKPVFAARRGEKVGEVAVRWGAPRRIAAVAAEDLFLVFPRAAQPRMDRELKLQALTAPVRDEQAVGTLTAVYDGQVRAAAPLVAEAAVTKDWLAVATQGLGVTMGLMLLGLGPRYARAFAKGSRRRRRRVPARRGRVDPRGPRRRQRLSGLGAWD